MPERAIISVTNDLRTDQRVERVCNALSECGYEILMIGRDPRKDDKFQSHFKVKRIRMLFTKGFLFYAEFNIRLFWTLAFRKKNLLYANDLDTLLPNYLVSKISSAPLVYDSHEYFTEVPELQNRHFVKSVWEKLEAILFPKLKNVITVNEELARIYTEKYKVPVSVIRNVPCNRKGEGSNGVTNKSSRSQDLLIYQGALNLGRGIELMIDCMAHLPGVKLLIAGDGDIAEELINRVRMKNLGDRVFFKGRLDPDELKRLTLSASVGLSLEEDLGLNYRYALPNKIFDYIHAGIPVIVSDLPVMSNLVTENDVGEILKDRTPQGLAELVQQIVLKKELYAKNLEAAADRFNWNLEKKEFLNIIEHLE